MGSSKKPGIDRGAYRKGLESIGFGLGLGQGVNKGQGEGDNAAHYRPRVTSDPCACGYVR